jgi:hypothetical protein
MKVDGFTGELLEPADPGYNDARRLWNAMMEGWTKFERLVTLKNRWDPDNTFHLNANISPNLLTSK